MNWNMTDDDFSFMIALEPQGCFILYSDSKPIGLATTITFDHVGWVGNVIVDNRYRRQGAGSLLVQHALQYLDTQGVKTVYIYAYPAKQSFYQRLGFHTESTFIVLHGSPDILPQTSVTIIPATKTHHSSIIAFDYDCLGYSRRKLLSSLLSLSSTRCYIALMNDSLQGYAIIKDYGSMAELGPIVCTQKAKRTSSDLIHSALRDNPVSDTFMCIPQNECALIKSLKSIGFQEDFRVVRMLRGFPLHIDCMQIAESLERG
jgi:predicted GNAT family acetyltransferase